MTTPIIKYPNLVNFDVNKQYHDYLNKSPKTPQPSVQIDWNKLPKKSQSIQSQSKPLYQTLQEYLKQHPEITERLKRERDSTPSFDLNNDFNKFNKSMSLTRKPQVPTPEWVIKGFKSYADYERHQKLLDAPRFGKDGAGVAPWAKEGISYEQWRAKNSSSMITKQSQSWLFGWWWKQGQGKTPQERPLLGSDPITWSPIKKSSQTGTRTANSTTRKPMGLASLLNIAKVLVPTIWIGAKFAGDALIGTFFQGQYDSGYTFDKQPQDEIPSASEVKGEEILVATRADLTKREIIAAVADQAHIESSAFHMPTLGLKHSQVTISLHLEYTFSPQPTEVNTTVGLPNINFNDHIAMNLMPKNFAFYKNLLQHELIKFNNCTIVSSNTSGFDTTTNVGFFPATKLTTHVSNAVLLQMSKRLELDPEEKMAYTIRYVSPAIIKYAINEQQQYTKVQSLDMFLEPNKIIRTEYLQGLAADEALSYGTVVIVKQNVGSVIGMSYTVNMVFDVWDYIINGCKLEDVEDKNLDGDTTDPGESGNPDGGDDGNGSRPPAGSARVGRRQVSKK